MAPAPIPAPRVSGFTRSTGVPLYWCRYGPVGAPRLVMLHGGPGADHAYLLPQLLDLASDHELIFYDQRGGGRSRTDDPAPITWETHTGDLARVAGELGVERPTLVGYSWGGLLALLYAGEFARRHADAAPVPARLVLIDPAPVSRAYRARFEAEFARRQRGPVIQRMRAELAASGLRERDPQAYRQRAFELSVAGYFADPYRASDLTPFRVVGRVQQSVWESLGDFDLSADLARVRCPAIVVHGRQDPIPIESSETIAKLLNADFVPLDDCGHVPYVEQREKLRSALHAFLTRSR